MPDKIIRIQLRGDIADGTAEMLGCRVVRDATTSLVARHIDDAQLIGLLVQLADLHVGFDRVDVLAIDSP